MRAFFAAIRFLTVLPVPRSWAEGEGVLERSVPFFPLVGVIIGAAAAGLAAGLVHVLPPAPSAVVLVLALIAASGALHLDGLADTADGFLSSRPKQKVLEIMRDSASGAMGVLAISGILLMKVACFVSLPPEHWWRFALIVPVAGRGAVVLSMSLLRYARPSGLGTAFYEKTHGFALLISMTVLAAVAWGCLRMPGLLAAGVSVITVLVFCGWCQRRIGGSTGDTLGAACEIAEAGCLLALSALV